MPAFTKLTALGRKVQGDFVLSTARGFYLVGACLSLAAVLGAVIVAIVAHGGTFGAVRDRPVPEVRAPQAEPIDVQEVAARLGPPTRLGFVQEPEVIGPAVSEGQPLGYFDAATPNQLAAYPDDFDIVGGEHASLFLLGRHPSNGRAGLRASAALAQVLSDAQSGAATAPKQFRVRIIARDAVGQRSTPTDVVISLALGPPGAEATAPAPAQLTDIQGLAREIALAVDPAQTDLYYDVISSALRTPRLCGAGNSPEFLAQYRRGFEGVREQITPNNVGLFYRGVCDAWRAAIDRGEARVAREQAAADAVIARNLHARVTLETQKVRATSVRNTAMATAVAAVAAFLVIALFLAFLAMEGHSKALRDAVDIMASRS